jgi:hypothetical protein
MQESIILLCKPRSILNHGVLIFDFIHAATSRVRLRQQSMVSDSTTNDGIFHILTIPSTIFLIFSINMKSFNTVSHNQTTHGLAQLFSSTSIILDLYAAQSATSLSSYAEICIALLSHPGKS